MSKLKVLAFAVSIDGFGAGPDQSQQDPLGVGGMALHEWMFPTRTFQNDVLRSQKDGSTGVDDAFARRSFDNIGAWIMGRNMFAHSRGPWPDDGWKGWWGDEPPFHVPVYVLTHHAHHARESIAMQGGTTFHFVTGGIHEALRLAREAARGRDVRVGGGVATVRQYLQAGLVDEMHLAVSPTVLGRGEHLLGGIDLTALGLSCREHVATPNAMHVVLRRG